MECLPPGAQVLPGSRSVQKLVNYKKNLRKNEDNVTDVIGSAGSVAEQMDVKWINRMAVFVCHVAAYLIMFEK